MSRNKLIATVSLAVIVITMITSNQLSTYASPTTEDDGWTEGDYEGSPDSKKNKHKKIGKTLADREIMIMTMIMITMIIMKTKTKRHKYVQMDQYYP